MNSEVKARRALPDDAAEVARLREVMGAELFGGDEPGPWQDETVRRLRHWFGDPDAGTAAFVVDAPEGGFVAASAVGVIIVRLPNSNNPSGLTGYVYGVCTDPRSRRRGYSRTVMRALLAWFAERDVTRVELHASEFGEGLYRELGFVDCHGTALSLKQ